jgi:uncharacterized membrane protein YcaP (DUF421 family)
MEIIMETLKHILQPTVASLITMVVLFILTTTMGKRQIAQLSFFDYIIGITIGSIAAEASVDPSTFLDGIVSMSVYALVALGISIGACKNIWLRRIINGKSTILYEKGVIYEKNLLQSRMDVGEFLMACRQSGYFDISKLEIVILEADGKMSFIPIAKEKPPVATDLGLTITQEKPLANVILDGKIMHQNLMYTGNNEVWLLKELSKQKKQLKNVFLATCDNNGSLTIYEKTKSRLKKELFT